MIRAGIGIGIALIAGCAEKVKQILVKKRAEQPETMKNGQMTLFQMGLDVGQCR